MWKKSPSNSDVALARSLIGRLVAWDQSGLFFFKPLYIATPEMALADSITPHWLSSTNQRPRSVGFLVARSLVSK